MHPSLVGPVQLKAVEAEIGTLSEASGDYDDETTSSLSEDNKSVSLSIYENYRMILDCGENGWEF